MATITAPRGRRDAPPPQAGGEDEAPLAVQILPLVAGLTLPVQAPARTRAHVPSGYGVQEQCLPFTAASALGFLIGSPITFGLCEPADVPSGATPFRSPVQEAGTAAAADTRVFYVQDDPRCRFTGNAFALDEIAPPGRTTRGRPPRVMPGVSFFDRPDQQDMFKLHLPIAWHTPPGVDCLFLPALNRSGPDVLAGLVETDTYATPVSLVLRRPAAGVALHVGTGDPVAQVCPIARAHRRAELQVLPSHARLARDLRIRLAAWYQRHADDRSAYKRMVRGRGDEA